MKSGIWLREDIMIKHFWCPCHYVSFIWRALRVFGWLALLAQSDRVGLEYTIGTVTCFFSQQGGAVKRRSGTRA
jgi:hypothetical protein